MHRYKMPVCDQESMLHCEITTHTFEYNAEHCLNAVAVQTAVQPQSTSAGFSKCTVIGKNQNMED